MLNLFEEEHINLCIIVNHIDVGAVIEKFRNGKESVIGSDFDIFHKFVIGVGVELFIVKVIYACFERTHSFKQ